MEFSYFNNFLPDDPEELCRYIGDENIFKLVFEKVEFGVNYISPLRQDSRAGCFFWETPDSRIYFIDYGNPIKTHLLSIEFIKQYYKFNTLFEAINFVKKKFRSHIGTTIPESERIHIIGERTRKIIKLFPRVWNTQDRLFWSKYGISRSQLEQDNVVPISYYQVYTGNNFETYSTSQAYAYNFIDHTIKIYRPFDSFKWYTNSSADTIGNIENIDEEGDILIISKSYKDHRVLKNIGYHNTVWFQNEGQIPKIETFLNLISRFKTVYIFFDNDEAGISSSKRVSTFMNNLIGEDKVKCICIPKEYIKKDPSDFYEKFGEEQLKILTNKLIQDVTREKS